MRTAHVLLTGGTGFIGTEVLRRLVAEQATVGRTRLKIRLLTHRREPLLPVGADVEVVHGDLADAATLRGVCTGIDTVLHLASQIGGDADSCREVNVLGTAALLGEAARAGVRRIVQLSTTAVYQEGVHQNLREDQIPLSPGSATSRTRLAAERQVLAAGGIVIRPHLVYGAGDTWVVPAVADLLRRVPHWINGGDARISMIAVDDLARPLAALATAGWEPSGGQVYHACHPEPVLARDLLTLVADQLGLPLPAGDLSLTQAQERLAASGEPHWARRLSLLVDDHWYESSRLWQRTGCVPGPGLAARFVDHAPWYREVLGSVGGAESSA